MENVADQELKVNQKSSGFLTKSEKILLGCKALGGQPVRELCEESGVSRTWVYQQKEDVTQYASALDEQEEVHRSIQVTEQFIERLVLSLALDCRGPLEGIRRTFRSVIGVNLSIGKISAMMRRPGGQRNLTGASRWIRSVRGQMTKFSSVLSLS